MIANQVNEPILRFPEFKEDWLTKTLSEVANFRRGSFPQPYGLPEWFDEENGIPFVQVYDVDDNMLLKRTTKTKISKLAAKQSVFIKAGTLIITIQGSIGRIAKTQYDAYVDRTLLVFKSFNIPIELDFFKYELYLLFEYEKTKAPGGTIKTITKEVLSGFKINYPSISEQQKIASFLINIDTKIELLTKKKNLLEQYKEGVMQQLFIQQIRFKDDKGNDFPEWEVKQFGELVSFHSTNSFSRELLNYEVGSVKNIHYGDIHTKYKMRFDVEKENVPFINQDVKINKIPKESYCITGDLIIADASEDYKDIGKSVEIINVNGQKLTAGLHTYIARDKTKNALGFKGYLMQSRNVRLQIMKFATGVSVLGISKANLSKIKVNIPSYQEQTKITSFLSKIDDKIDVIENQIAYTKTYKKGLLQQLFV